LVGINKTGCVDVTCSAACSTSTAELHERFCAPFRLTEGKSKKEAIRCLQRYVAREVFAVLSQTTHDTRTPAA